VSRDMSGVDLSQVQQWTQETIKVLRGDTKLDLSDWKASPVGKAIQLVLVRPDPSVFRKWKDDLPLLPPAVWWSAATLCGLLHGYRRLPTSFRGEAEQQRLFAIHALRALGAAPVAENWAALVQGNPEWCRQSGDIIFSWSGTPFARKSENARGRWFNAKLDDVAARKAAEEISRSNGWACIITKVTVPAGDIPFSGGSLEVSPAPQQHLTLKGPTEFTLPLGAAFEPILDIQEFRRCIATEGATIPTLETQRRIAPSASEEIPGLLYVPNFLTEPQEAELVAIIDKGEWSTVLKRRVQHFGWRYDYKSREIDMSMRLGSLPEWAMVIAKRLKAEGLMPHLADQVIVNEYVGNQGISKHIDCVPCFDDGVAMVSLLESWEMIFRQKGGRANVPKLLEHRSVAIMTGDVRYHWSHEIPARNTEPTGLRRKRRVSVTFRKVNDAAVVREPRRFRKGRSV
jgi:alkylated DNA repair dioxygenase AlkB